MSRADFRPRSLVGRLSLGFFSFSGTTTSFATLTSWTLTPTTMLAPASSSVAATVLSASLIPISRHPCLGRRTVNTADMGFPWN